MTLCDMSSVLTLEGNRAGRANGAHVAIERVFYCDWRECDHHAQTANPRPVVFLTVTERGGRALHFCSWDCVLKHAAEKPPVEVIPLADG